MGDTAMGNETLDDRAASAREVIAFWFDEAGPKRWFTKDADFDGEIGRRFGELRQAVIAGEAAGWRDAVEPLLAAVLLTDQFSRNIHCGSARAFEADSLALDMAYQALDRDWAHTAPRAWRQFLLTPLMHSERLSDQERSVAEFEGLGDPELIPFAVQHRDQIARFGRFPGRNAALRRDTTAVEQQALDAGAAF